MTTAGGWEAARSGGAVGWGLAELSKLGATPWGGSFVAPTCPQISWKFSKLTLAPCAQRSPTALQPQPRCTGAAPPAHPPRPGGSRFLTPQQMDTFPAPPLGGPGGPSHPRIPTLPVPAASPALSAPTLPPSLWPDPHLFEEVPAGPEPLHSLSPPPSAPPELTLMRTSASMMEVKVCMSSPSAMVLPGPSAPGARSRQRLRTRGLMQEPGGGAGRGGGKIPLRMLQGRASTSASRGGRWERVFPTWFSEGGGGVAGDGI